MTDTPEPTAGDLAILRRASLRIALRISAACAVLVLCLLAAATFYLLHQAGNAPAGGTDPRYAYLDTDDLIKAMIVAGVVGILLAGGVGWVSARSAIRPLGAALALQRRFVQDASHEMRTPLAILDARIQLAQRVAAPDSSTGQALARIRSDTSELTLIVNELLEAAAGSAASPDTAPTDPTDVATVAGGVANNLQLLASAREISVECNSAGHPRARIAPQRLHRAILGLAENALAHTPTGGLISITANASSNQVVITVADTGPGITGIDKHRIFDRFARTTRPAMGQEQRNFGIGLALVRDIATAAGGSADVASTGPQGTCMRIVLPLAT